MSLSHDPRPASRYQAVTPSAFRDQLGAAPSVAVAPPPATTGTRVLRRVPAQLIRLGDR